MPINAPDTQQQAVQSLPTFDFNALYTNLANSVAQDPEFAPVAAVITSVGKNAYNGYLFFQQKADEKTRGMSTGQANLYSIEAGQNYYSNILNTIASLAQMANENAKFRDQLKFQYSEFSQNLVEQQKEYQQNLAQRQQEYNKNLAQRQQEFGSQFGERQKEYGQNLAQRQLEYNRNLAERQAEFARDKALQEQQLGLQRAGIQGRLNEASFASMNQPSPFFTPPKWTGGSTLDTSGGGNTYGAGGNQSNGYMIMGPTPQQQMASRISNFMASQPPGTVIARDSKGNLAVNPDTGMFTTYTPGQGMSTYSTNNMSTFSPNTPQKIETMPLYQNPTTGQMSFSQYDPMQGGASSYGASSPYAPLLYGDQGEGSQSQPSASPQGNNQPQQNQGNYSLFTSTNFSTPTNSPFNFYTFGGQSQAISSPSIPQGNNPYLSHVGTEEGKDVYVDPNGNYFTPNTSGTYSPYTPTGSGSQFISQNTPKNIQNPYSSTSSPYSFYSSAPPQSFPTNQGGSQYQTTPTFFNSGTASSNPFSSSGASF